MNSGNIERALTIANAVRALRRWWWLLLLSTVVAAAGAYVSTRNTPKYYQAATTLYVGRILQQAHPDPNSITLLDRLTAVYANLAVREPVLDAAARSVTPPAVVSDIVSRVNVRAVNGTQFIEITYLDQDPHRAAQIVTAIANALIQQGPKPAASQSPQQSQFVQMQLAMLQTQINDGQQQIAQLEAGIAQSSSAAEIADAQEKEKVLRVQMDTWRSAYAALLNQTQPSETNYLTIVEPPAIPTRPVGSGRTSTIGLAALLGFILAFGVVLLLEAFDDTVREPDTMHAHLGLDTVAMLPNAHHRTAATAPAFAAVRNSLLREKTTGTLRVLVTASDPAVGVTSTAAGIAEAFARSGRRVILVDANVGAPTLHQRYHTSSSPGLVDAINWPDAVACALHPCAIPNLLIVPAGETTTDDVLVGRGVPYVFDALTESTQADVLIVDGGAVTDATSALCILAAELPHTVLIADSRTRLRALRHVIEILTSSGTNIIGVVFNQRTRARGASSRPEQDRVPALSAGDPETRPADARNAPVPLHPLVRDLPPAGENDADSAEAARVAP